MSFFTDCFRVPSTSQVVYIRRQSDAQLSRINAREIFACDRCRVIGVIIISLCYIISLSSYVLRVRFGSGVRLEPKEKLNMFQLRKSLKVGQTTVFCRAQDYKFLKKATVTFQTTTIQTVFRVYERYLLTQWKTLKGRCDKLLKLRISLAFYRQDICVGFALKCYTIVVGINESEQYFNAILSQCFSIHQSKFPTAGHLVI